MGIAVSARELRDLSILAYRHNDHLCDGIMTDPRAALHLRNVNFYNEGSAATTAEARKSTLYTPFQAKCLWTRAQLQTYYIRGGKALGS